MRYYRPSQDWITNLAGPHRESFARTLRGLGLDRLQKYPPPKLAKMGGLPFGNETRVFERFIRGESAQLDASALHKFYLTFADERDALLYRAFRRNDPLPREQWGEMIGPERVDKWLRHKFLREAGEDEFICKFSVVVLDGLLLLVDPLNDHGNPHETIMLPEDFVPEPGDDDIAQFNHAYIGLDSLRQIDVMTANRVRNGKSYLDCGPGAGAILLYFARKFDRAVGIDINPRAAALARFNAELNEMANVEVHEGNALELKDKYEKFDLISWNLPFMFFPEEFADSAVDAFGGEMGIGLCLAFIETLPGILADRGTACIAALAPILDSGENVLEHRLSEMLPRLGLDCTMRVTQVSLAHTKEIWDFHRSHNIRKFESVYLYFKYGRGELNRIESPATRKLIDAIRERMYQRKFA